MPSDINENKDNILEFLNYMNKDFQGDINIKYIDYLSSINNLANNSSYEISQYNNFVNTINNNFPNFNTLKHMIDTVKHIDPIHFHRKLCIYLWYWIYH